MSFDDILGPPVDPAYRRAVERQRAERNPPSPPFPCTPADLEATGDEGHLGLMLVLINSGWAISEQRRDDGQIVVWAKSSGYTRGESADTESDAMLKLFKALYSDEPDAIACACAFWPPAAPDHAGYANRGSVMTASEVTARDHLVGELTRTTKRDLVTMANAVAPTRGDHWLIGGPDTWSKDELIAYLAPERES
jgi:hypothetical protein